MRPEVRNAKITFPGCRECLPADAMTELIPDSQFNALPKIYLKQQITFFEHLKFRLHQDLADVYEVQPCSC